MPVLGPAAIMTAVDQMFKDEGAKIAPKIHAPQAKPDSTGSSVAYQVAQNTMSQLPVLGPAISALEGLFGVKPGKPLATPEQSSALPPAEVGRGGVRTATPAPGSAYTLPPQPQPENLLGGAGRASTVEIKPKVDAAGRLVPGGVQQHPRVGDAPTPVKIPAPDTSALKTAASQVQAEMTALEAVHPKPIKIPSPDLSALKAAAGAAASAGAAAGAGFAAGIAGEAGAAAAAAAGVAAAATAAFKANLKISSPSKVTEAIGHQTGEGLAKGITDSKPAVNAAAASIGSSSVASLIQGLEGGQSNQQNVQSAIYGALANPDAVTTVQQTVQTLLQDIPAGKDLGLVKWLGQQQSKLTALANKQGALWPRSMTPSRSPPRQLGNASITSAYGYTPALAASSGPLAAQSTVTGLAAAGRRSQSCSRST